MNEEVRRDYDDDGREHNYMVVVSGWDNMVEEWE